jgi:hypothetical protein
MSYFELFENMFCRRRTALQYSSLLRRGKTGCWARYNNKQTGKREEQLGHEYPVCAKYLTKCLRRARMIFWVGAMHSEVIHFLASNANDLREGSSFLVLKLMSSQDLVLPSSSLHDAINL